ncbi:ABC transporter ATP-binding protein [Alkalitalea saponilacus]|uniref:Putative ABC transport system ATP-binding protein n=1 Tax=Alkalitalea saponilacus TaxID=889453 RepID=A0A1T5BKD9_9BACT|nr:ABC transporter ATP-binding protein [Alkalitalea saponilacus]ASB49665.1 phosphonate ABC transporter ATP-binding protein [Alkalitalea saponilacus]SKB47479.1 putative ABC transport system ATP-binding protein [Alkalitalea saponilacus]
MIYTRNLKKLYKSREVETMALINVNIDIDEGEFVAVAGPAGSGKSSLFNILGLLDTPDSGEVFFMGKECSRLSQNKRISLRRGNIGYMFKDFNLVDELSVYNNIELPLLYMPYSRKDRQKMVSEILYKFKLDHKRNNYPEELTRLQQQTVGLARATVYNPKLILADEPAGSLDSTGGGMIFELISSVNEAGTTVIFFTNSISEAQRASRIIRLFDGHIVTEAIQKEI